METVKSPKKGSKTSTLRTNKRMRVKLIAITASWEILVATTPYPDYAYSLYGGVLSNSVPLPTPSLNLLSSNTLSSAFVQSLFDDLSREIAEETIGNLIFEHEKYTLSFQNQISNIFPLHLFLYGNTYYCICFCPDLTRELVEKMNEKIQKDRSELISKIFEDFQDRISWTDFSKRFSTILLEVLSCRHDKASIFYTGIDVDIEKSILANLSFLEKTGIKLVQMLDCLKYVWEFRFPNLRTPIRNLCTSILTFHENLSSITEDFSDF